MNESNRRFTILDALVLIVGLAVGMVLVKDCSPSLSHPNLFGYAFGLVGDIAVPSLAAMSPACLLLHAITPRPRWRKLRRRPGFVACLLSTAAILAFETASYCSGGSMWNAVTVYTRFTAGLAIGSGVACGWLTLRMSGAWRAGPDWLDRSGKLLGVAWLVLGLVCFAYYFVF